MDSEDDNLDGFIDPGGSVPLSNKTIKLTEGSEIPPGTHQNPPSSPRRKASFRMSTPQVPPIATSNSFSLLSNNIEEPEVIRSSSARSASGQIATSKPPPITVFGVEIKELSRNVSATLPGKQVHYKLTQFGTRIYTTNVDDF